MTYQRITPVLRRFLEPGIESVRSFLESVGNPNGVAEQIQEMLDDVQITEVVPGGVPIEDRRFNNRGEAGKYLYEKFESCGLAPGSSDRGLWTWLSLFYFDQLCSRDVNGRFDPKSIHRWIPLDDFRHYYRHLLAGPYEIYRSYRNEIGLAHILLCQDLSSPGDFVEQLTSRQAIVQNKSIIGAATRLYYDAVSGKPKRGAAPAEHRPGTLRRFVDLLRQLDRTWDLHAMSVDQVLRLLPREFANYE